MQIRSKHLLLGVSAAVILHLGMASLFVNQTPSTISERSSSVRDGLAISLHSIQNKADESKSSFEPEVRKVDASSDRKKLKNHLENAKKKPLSKSPQPGVDVSVSKKEELKKDSVAAFPPVRPKPSVMVSSEPKNESRLDERKIPVTKDLNNDSGIKLPDVKEPEISDANKQVVDSDYTDSVKTEANPAESITGKRSLLSETSNPLNAQAISRKKDEYFKVLRNWLEQHKKYPRRARARRQEGVVVLRFVLDEQGSVTDYEIEDSSGYRALDQEVERMIQAADPLPKIPSELKQTELELIIPIRFSLQ